MTPERRAEIEAWAAGPGSFMRALTETLAALAAAEARAAAAEQRAEAAEQALRAAWGIIHEGLHGGKPTDPEHQRSCEKTACRRIRAILQAADQRSEGVGE